MSNKFHPPGGEVQGAVPPAARAVRHEQGEELHGGGGPVPGVHAQQAGLGQGERVRRAQEQGEEGAAVQVRLVPQVQDFAGEFVLYE